MARPLKSKFKSPLAHHHHHHVVNVLVKALNGWPKRRRAWTGIGHKSGDAKPYQLRQLLRLAERHALTLPEEKQ